MDKRKARDALERRLRFKLSDDEWELMLEDGYDEEILGDLAGQVSRERGLDMAAERIKRLRRVYKGVRTEPERVRMVDKERETGLLVHDRALSVALGALASRLEEVRNFRREVLGDTLLSWGEIKEWVESQMASDGAATTYLKVPLPPETKIATTRSGVELDPEVRLGQLSWGAFASSTRVLKYALEDGGWATALPVAAGGVLDKLRNLSEDLEQRFGWGSAEACVFVLTGMTPLLADMRAHQQLKLTCSAASRIVLEIDPTVDAGRVAAFYRQTRSRWLAREHRRQSPKRLRLAVYTLEMRQRGIAWAEIMKEWNKTYGSMFPGGTYSHGGNFRRDAGQAQRQLLGARVDYRTMFNSWRCELE